eukprot:gene5141-8781_t
MARLTAFSKYLSSLCSMLLLLPPSLLNAKFDNVFGHTHYIGGFVDEKKYAVGGDMVKIIERRIGVGLIIWTNTKE